MRQSTMILVGAGIVLIGGGLLLGAMAPHHTPQIAAKPVPTVHLRKTIQRSTGPVQNVSAKSTPVITLTAVASLAAARRIPVSQVPPLWRVQDPQHRTTEWAFLPLATKNGTLWFGQKLPQQAWHWTPVRLPAAIPHTLPTPVYDSLAWSYDLHEGERGPNVALGSAGNWVALAGTMGEPRGWQAQASTLGNGAYAVDVTPWMAADHLSHVYFGLVTQWTAANASTGNGAIDMILHTPGPLAQIVVPPAS